MIQYCDIPLINPFKFYKNNIVTEGIDGDWAYNQIKSFESKKYYYKKWQIGDSTALQITSTIAPAALKIYDCHGTIVRSIAWTNPLNNVYEVMVNLDGLGQDIFYLYFDCTLLLTAFKWISEPVYVKDKWANTKLIKYFNTYNDQDIVFISGVQFMFRCECGIMDFNPGRERNSFVDEIHDTKTLSATPYREYKLFVGEAQGVAVWVVDTLNRIFCCNQVFIDGLQYETTEGSKWEITRQKGWPLIGAGIEITEAKNLTANQQNAGSVNPGIITGYTLDTNFFGTAQQIQIIQVETTN